MSDEEFAHMLKRASIRMRKKPTTYKVPMSWVRAYPRHGMNLKFWVAVSMRVRAQRIAHKDLVNVKRVCREVGLEQKLR